MTFPGALHPSHGFDGDLHQGAVQGLVLLPLSLVAMPCSFTWFVTGWPVSAMRCSAPLSGNVAVT